VVRRLGAAVSVVMPLYNKEAMVERALGSVLGQRYADFEVIVVNDGSTDEGRAVVSSIADPRIRIVDQSNRGEGGARNRGIQEAHGSLVAFCDADDEWMPGFLGTVVRLKEAFPRCRVFGTGHVMREPGGRERHQLLVGVPPVPWEGVVDRYFRAACGSDGPLFVSAFAADREALQLTGGFPEGVHIGADLLGIARLASRWGVAFSTEPQVVFSLRDAYPSRPVRFPDIPDVVGTEFADMASNASGVMKEDLRRYIALWHRMRGTIFTYHGERRHAVGELIRALRFAPGDTKLYATLGIAVLPRALRESALGAVGCWRDRRRS
jgi:glycosyltransferase involved in cell wall biosynthesis